MHDLGSPLSNPFQRTRLGKFVNLIRKNTSEPDIANKARSLVKKWKKLVIGAKVQTLTCTPPPPPPPVLHLH